MSRVVPGFIPKHCPTCRSTLIVPSYVKVKWKHLVAVGIEMEDEKTLPIYKCGECGYIVARAFRERDTITYTIPEKEAYVIEDTDGVMHYLISIDKGDPVRPIQKDTRVAVARLIIPSKPQSALIVELQAKKTYRTMSGKPAWCELHQRREVIESYAVRREGQIQHYREYTENEVELFKKLIKSRRLRGSPSVQDGVLAYLISCFKGTASQITGFLNASGEFTTYKSTVGQALSRMQKLDLMPPEANSYWRVAERKTNGDVFHAYVPVNWILQEKEYVLRREGYSQLQKTVHWWKILDKGDPKTIGLERWF